MSATVDPFVGNATLVVEAIGDAGLAGNGVDTVLPANIRTPFGTSPYLGSYRKRLMDICVSALVLLLALPALAVVTLAIKATSKGPVLFKQRRAGLNGQPFTMLKFRSMTYQPSADGGVVQATRNDPRITAVGRFLRVTSIDELPQLLNVLKGEMSLIGPRPHAVFHDHYYRARIPQYKCRSAVRPGLTGLAQVSGARGETPQVADMERRVDLDCDYIRSATVLGDIFLLIATAKEMMMSKTAL